MPPAAEAIAARAQPVPVKTTTFLIKIFIKEDIISNKSRSTIRNTFTKKKEKSSTKEGGGGGGVAPPGLPLNPRWTLALALGNCSTPRALHYSVLLKIGFVTLDPSRDSDKLCILLKGFVLYEQHAFPTWKLRILKIRSECF